MLKRGAEILRTGFSQDNIRVPHVSLLRHGPLGGAASRRVNPKRSQLAHPKQDTHGLAAPPNRYNKNRGKIVRNPPAVLETTTPPFDAINLKTTGYRCVLKSSLELLETLYPPGDFDLDLTPYIRIL